MISLRPLGTIIILMTSPIDPFLDKQGALLLDGGLATELEGRGFKLDSKLWSAALLSRDPDAIRAAHLAYLEAGADCVTTASYQASLEGFLRRGYSEGEGRRFLKRSSRLALEAREEWAASSKDSSRLAPLVAASIGPYGAALANGAEYRGNYEISKEDLREFHEPRWEILAGTSVDLLACETIPSYGEAEVLRGLFQETGFHGWVSFSCRDGEHICDGTPIAECAALFADCESVVAVGVNCTAPRHVASLIRSIKEALPNKEIVVYPNSGEVYDVGARAWAEASETSCERLDALGWFRLGARLIGGCCRVGPSRIERMRAEVLERGGCFS